MASCGGDESGACQSLYRTMEEDLLSSSASSVPEEDTIHRLSKLSKGELALCSKCRQVEPASNGLCLPCFRSYLFCKFKLAITSKAMISPSDRVLVAFSGGPASRVALQFILDIQYKLLKNWDASKSQGLPVFGIGVAFVDQSSISFKPSNLMNNAIAEISSIVSELAPLHVVSIESIFGKGFDDGIKCLNELLDSITDATGKGDFIKYLRMLSLQKIALDNKYSKLLLGSCTSKMAREIISATVKGQGFSLPADLQYVDARWEVPIVLPLRDCLAQELALICHLDGLKTVSPFNSPSAGINDLVASFIARLQDENPSRERTIVRTAEKLKPFSFKNFTKDECYDYLPSIIRPKFQNMKNEESESEVLCNICRSPLNESEWQHFKGCIHGKCQTETEIFVSQCCQCCRFQILPKDKGSLEKFYSLLPSSISERMMNKGCVDQRLLRRR